MVPLSVGMNQMESPRQMRGDDRPMKSAKTAAWSSQWGKFSCLPWAIAVCLIVVGVSSAGPAQSKSDETISAAKHAEKTSANMGEEVASFYVRAVTGPLAGKSICYVCRHGDRPVVMVLVRELGADVAALLKELDRCVNRHRADGLRCFAVLVTGAPQREAPRLQTLSFDEKLELPLTLAGEAIADAAALNIEPDAAITAILYEDRHIVSRFSFRTGTCDAVARQSVVSAAEQLAAADRSR